MKSMVVLTNTKPLVLLSFSDMIEGVKESDVVRAEQGRLLEEMQKHPGDQRYITAHTMLGVHLVELESQGR